MKNSLILIIAAFILFPVPQSGAQTIKVFEKENVKEIHFSYRGLNGTTSSTIDRMLEWFYNPEDPGSLSFKLMFDESISVEFVDGLSYDVTVNIEDLYVRSLSKYAGFDLSEEFMPTRVELYVDLFKNDRRWKAKRIEAPLVGHGLREPVTFTVIDSIPGLRAKISGHDFLFTRDSENAVMNKLKLVNEYIDAFEEIDAIGLNLNDLDENTRKVRVFENHKAEIDKLEKRFAAVQDERFWKILDYKSAEARTGLDIEATRDEVKGYLAYKKEKFGLAASNFHTVYFEKGLDLYNKGKRSKAFDQFLLAKNSNPEFAPARYMVALLLYEDNLVDSSAAEVVYVLSRLKPDKETYDKTLELAYVIKERYMENGLSLIGNAPEEEVVEWFRKALDLCRDSMEMICDQRDFEAAMDRLQQAKNDGNQ